MHIPEGSFKFTVGEGKFEEIIQKFGGPNALQVSLLIVCQYYFILCF